MSSVHPVVDLDEVYRQCILECERCMTTMRRTIDEVNHIGLTPQLEINLYNQRMSLSAWLAELRLCYDSIMSPRHMRLYRNTRRYINYQKRVRKLIDYSDYASAQIKDLRANGKPGVEYWMQRQIRAEHLLNRLQAAMVEIEDASEIQQVGDTRYHSMLSYIEIQAKNLMTSLEGQQVA